MKTKPTRGLHWTVLCTLALTGLSITVNPQTLANKSKEIMIIHVNDVHDHMRSHDENFLVSGNHENAGGIAKASNRNE